MGNEVIGSRVTPNLMQGLGDILTSVGTNTMETGSTGFDWLDSILGMGGGGNDLFGSLSGENSPMGQQSDIGDLGGLLGFFDNGDSFSNNAGDVASDPKTWQQLAMIFGGM
jgi:hypothetical protein